MRGQVFVSTLLTAAASPCHDFVHVTVCCVHARAACMLLIACLCMCAAGAGHLKAGSSCNNPPSRHLRACWPQLHPWRRPSPSFKSTSRSCSWGSVMVPRSHCRPCCRCERGWHACCGLRDHECRLDLHRHWRVYFLFSLYTAAHFGMTHKHSSGPADLSLLLNGPCSCALLTCCRRIARMLLSCTHCRPLKASWMHTQCTKRQQTLSQTMSGLRKRRSHRHRERAAQMVQVALQHRGAAVGQQGTSRGAAMEQQGAAAAAGWVQVWLQTPQLGSRAAQSQHSSQGSPHSS